MIQVIFATIITAMLVNGLQIITGDRMVFEFVKKWLDKRFIVQRVDKTAPDVAKIYYPILYCIKCMPSLYGTIICLLFLPFTWHLIYLIPVVCICSSALASIIHSQYL